MVQADQVFTIAVDKSVDRNISLPVFFPTKPFVILRIILEPQITSYIVRIFQWAHAHEPFGPWLGPDGPEWLRGSRISEHIRHGTILDAVSHKRGIVGVLSSEIFDF